MMLGVLFAFPPMVIGGHVVRVIVGSIDMFNFLKSQGGFKMRTVKTKRIKRTKKKVNKVRAQGPVQTLIKVGQLGAQTPSS